MIDTEALVWAYNKLQAFGVGSSNMDSAMMLDRLKDMLFAAPTPPAQEDGPVAHDMRMDAYYYRFDSTGVLEIDKILSAIAWAGKSYHHTCDWCEDANPYESHTGQSPIEWIQNAANEAAMLCKKRPDNRGLRKAAGDAVFILRCLSVDENLTEGWRDRADRAANGLSAALAAAPALPAQDDEPVAWVEVKDSHNGPYEFHGQELLPPGKHNLYTRPDNSGLRKAAERVIHCWRRENWTDGMPDLNTCLKWLSDALEEK